MSRDHPYVQQVLNKLAGMGLHPELESGRKQLISLGSGSEIHLKWRERGATHGWEIDSFNPELSDFLMLVMGDDVWIIPANRVRVFEITSPGDPRRWVSSAELRKHGDEFLGAWNQLR